MIDNMKESEQILQVIVVDPIWDNWQEVGWFIDEVEASQAMGPFVLAALSNAGGEFMDKYDTPLSEDDLAKLIRMPDDFIHVYPSTFSLCLDRPGLTYEDLLAECFCDADGNQVVFMDPDKSVIDLGDIAMVIRGFVHCWDRDVADAVINMWDQNF